MKMRTRTIHRRVVALATLSVLGLLCQSSCRRGPQGLKFHISFTEERSEEALDGRMLLMISTNDSEEPRFQIDDGPETQLIFGVDRDGLRPGEEAVIDSGALGYPLKSVAEIPSGEYTVQALLHRYETFQRADGHVVKLPMDRGEGQKWNRAPGNFYSTPEKIRIDPNQNEPIRIVLDQEIQPFPEPKDTKYIKNIYPKPIWDKATGDIDRSVAEYMRENNDLRYVLERDWKELGPKLEGKLHIYCGDMDDHYLGNAVYLMEEFLESTTDPYYGGVVEYGDRFSHCWSGDPNSPNSISRLTYVQRFAPQMMKRMLETAPPGADTTSWRY